MMAQPDGSDVAAKIQFFDAKLTTLRLERIADMKNAGVAIVHRRHNETKPPVSFEAFAKTPINKRCPKLVCNFSGAASALIDRSSNVERDKSSSNGGVRDLNSTARSRNRQWNCSTHEPEIKMAMEPDRNDENGFCADGRAFTCGNYFHAPGTKTLESRSNVEGLGYNDGANASSKDSHSRETRMQRQTTTRHTSSDSQVNRTELDHATVNSLLNRQDRLNNNYKSFCSGNISHAGDSSNSQSKVVDEHESDSSGGFLSCREKCLCCFESEAYTDSSTVSDETGDFPPSSRQAFTSNTDEDSSSIGFGELSTISNKSGSTKRSSTVLYDNESSEYQESSRKRLRKNDGQGLDLPMYAGEYDHVDDSEGSSDDSPLATSSYTTERTGHNQLSPLAAQEAEYEYECGRANLPESFESPEDYRREDNQLYKSSSDERVTADFNAFSEVFSTPDHLPFQLHPAHNENLEDYYNFMRRKELISHPSNCLKGQPKIKHSMRRILVEWLTKISHHYKLNGQSLHLTINVLDRYTERQKGFYRGHYQLLGVTSLLVATKQLEVDIPPVSTCLMLCRNLYSKTQLLSLERHLLDILEFDLNIPTAHTFLDYYIISLYYDALRLGERRRDLTQSCMSYEVPDLKKLLCVSRCLLDYGLADYEFCQRLPSIIALAAMRLAKELMSANQIFLRGHCRRVGYYSRFCRDIDGPRCQSCASVQGSAGASVQGSAGASNSSRTFAPLCDSDMDQFHIIDCAHSLRTLVGKEKLDELQDSPKCVVEKYSFE